MTAPLLVVSNGNGEDDIACKVIDALRASPAAVRQYNELKHAAANLGVDEYRKAKRAFIDQILATIG